jgi:hypothetical protein
MHLAPKHHFYLQVVAINVILIEYMVPEEEDHAANTEIPAWLAKANFLGAGTH